jgi:DedD protein
LNATSIIRAVDGSVKERLTGALIFVAAVVIIVPEMISGPWQDDRAVEAPADPADVSAPMRTYSMPVDGAAGSVAAVEVPAAPVHEPAVAEPPLAAPAAVLQPVAPQVAAPQAAAAGESPPAAPAAAPAPKERPVTGGKWWTQVGIFSSRENAERLAKRLRTDGFDLEISQYVSGGKDMFRVRAGPVQDRAEAVALQARLKAAGHTSLLVAP